MEEGDNGCAEVSVYHFGDVGDTRSVKRGCGELLTDIWMLQY